MRAGEASNDKRLLPLDARGTARPVRLQAVQPNGEPLRRRDVTVAPLNIDSDVTERTDDEGRITVLLPRAVTEVRVALNKNRIVRVALNADDSLVRVELVGE